jgi:hypothetical protein
VFTVPSRQPPVVGVSVRLVDIDQHNPPAHRVADDFGRKDIQDFSKEPSISPYILRQLRRCTSERVKVSLLHIHGKSRTFMVVWKTAMNVLDFAPLLGLAGCLQFVDTCFRDADHVVEAVMPPQRFGDLLGFFVNPESCR